MREIGNAVMWLLHAVGYVIGVVAAAAWALALSFWLGIHDGWTVLWR